MNIFMKLLPLVQRPNREFLPQEILLTMTGKFIYSSALSKMPSMQWIVQNNILTRSLKKSQWCHPIMKSSEKKINNYLKPSWNC